MASSGITPGDFHADLRLDADWVAIVNPAAGNGLCGKKAPTAIQTLRRSGLSIAVRTTQRPGDGRKVACDALDAGFSNLLVLGGDGTVNEVVNGIMRDGPKPDVALGILPLGTGNSFLRDFDLQDLDAALRRILTTPAAPCDLLRCTMTVDGTPRQQWALGNVIVGFGADVGQTVNRHFKSLGKLGYTVGVVVEVARLKTPEITIECDGETVKEAITLLTVSNAQYAGGNMRIAPTADVTDGLFDLVRVGAMGRRRILRLFPLVYGGGHSGHPSVTIRRGRRVCLSSDAPCALLVDGELIGTTPVEIEVVPQAISIIR